MIEKTIPQESRPREMVADVDADLSRLPAETEHFHSPDNKGSIRLMVTTPGGGATGASIYLIGPCHFCREDALIFVGLDPASALTVARGLETAARRRATDA